MVAHEVARQTVDRIRHRGLAAGLRILRLTAAAVLSYLVARALLPQSRPLTGPLTSLLVVQATLFSTVTIGLQRVVAVVSGVLAAVILSSFLGLTWWSLGAIIAVSLAIGLALRLGDMLLEVPISGMLLLGLGATGIGQATDRVIETLIGAGVGVLVNVIWAPPVRSKNAAVQVEQVAAAAARVLERASRAMPSGVTRDQALDWLAEMRRVGATVSSADQAVTEAAESRRLNPRAVGTRDADPILRSGLDALEHTVVGLRALFRAIADEVPEEPEEPKDDGAEAEVHQTQSQPVYGEDLRRAFAVLLDDVAATLRAFGALTRIEAAPATVVVGVGARDNPVEAAAESALAATLDALRETRALLTELLMVDAAADPARWLLRGSMLGAVERVVRELDVEERARRRRRWQEEESGRGRGSQAVGRLRSSSRQIAAHGRPRRPRARR